MVSNSFKDFVWNGTEAGQKREKIIMKREDPANKSDPARSLFFRPIKTLINELKQKTVTQKEAIDELIIGIDYILDEIEQHERFEDEEQGEFQIKAYETNKKELEAYQVVFGALDPSLSTAEGLRERCNQVKEERYGSVNAGELPEPSEFEKELAEIMTPWYKKEVENNGGYGTQLDLETDENAILAQINMEKGTKRVVIGVVIGDVDEPCDSDTFAFYPYRGRIQVVYNEYADGEFCEYPLEFQEKALEIIKKKLENL